MFNSNLGYYNFFKLNRGLTNPIINLTNNIGLTEAETQEDIWQLFNNFLCSEIENEIFRPEEPIRVFGKLEGDKIIRKHIKQELKRRNSKTVQLAKTLALKNNNGRLKCECCNFDFVDFYGQLGMNFIECHHKIHISTGERITKIEDLALVCSNCHRMLHRRLEDGNYHEIETLKKIIMDNKGQ
ncbi:HNH endonuclease [Parapedobacter sp. 2B3]|uniref:HNH endonuclease n=1 Tax=Parapedobacter sp. 2B3 TaxID=3342381 RepID=UPI0035B69FDD